MSSKTDTTRPKFVGSHVDHAPVHELQGCEHNHKLYIETVGCQMNMLDSELVVAALRKVGYQLTDQIRQADTILLNTCSVREHAEHKIYSRLGRLRQIRERRPNCVVGVMGCMAQKDQQLIFKRAPHVDIVVGTGQLAEIPRLIDEVRRQRQRKLAVSLDRRGGSVHQVSASFQSYDPLREPEMRPSPWQAFVRIMIGCDKFCTYCVVPMTRGPEQSRPPSDIAREVQVLAEQGVREVTLLGQTVNSYKHSKDGRLYRLSDLLDLIHDTDGIDRFKFVTNYPRDMSDDLLQALRDLPKVARYLHVPLQSGCDAVLKIMKRGYSVAEYRQMMHRIRELVPDCAVSSDFIVGHPGETEESFRRSMNAVREFRFKNNFIFKYSPRPGTKAYELCPDEIPDQVKRRRLGEMLALSNEICEADNAEFIGRQVEVLVEGPSKAAEKASRGERNPAFSKSRVSGTEPGSLAKQLVGRTRCDRIVVFDGHPRLAGSLVQIRVHDCTVTTLIGTVLTLPYQHPASVLLPIVS